MFLFNKEEKKHNASLSVGSVLRAVVASIWFPFIIFSYPCGHAGLYAVCVVDFVSLVIGHFLLEGHGGM